MVTWLDGGDPVISGSDAQVKPGSYQYTVTGGNGPYSWGVTGTGATIDSGGVLTLGTGACGSILVTCTDCTGRPTSQWVRVTNNGSWYITKYIPNCQYYYVYGCAGAFTDILIDGIYKHERVGATYWTACTSNGETLESLKVIHYWNSACDECPQDFAFIYSHHWHDCYICPGCEKDTWCVIYGYRKYIWGC